MPRRLETAHPKPPGEFSSERAVHDEAGACRARGQGGGGGGGGGHLLSCTKGQVLIAEGKRHPLNLE